MVEVSAARGTGSRSSRVNCTITQMMFAGCNSESRLRAVRFSERRWFDVANQRNRSVCPGVDATGDASQGGVNSHHYRRPRAAWRVVRLVREIKPKPVTLWMIGVDKIIGFRRLCGRTIRRSVRAGRLGTVGESLVFQSRFVSRFRWVFQGELACAVAGPVCSLALTQRPIDPARRDLRISGWIRGGVCQNFYLSRADRGGSLCISGSSPLFHLLVKPRVCCFSIPGPVSKENSCWDLLAPDSFASELPVESFFIVAPVYSYRRQDVVGMSVWLYALARSFRITLI